MFRAWRRYTVYRIVRRREDSFHLGYGASTILTDTGRLHTTGSPLGGSTLAATKSQQPEGADLMATRDTRTGGSPKLSLRDLEASTFRRSGSERQGVSTMRESNRRSGLTDAEEQFEYDEHAFKTQLSSFIQEARQDLLASTSRSKLAPSPERPRPSGDARTEAWMPPQGAHAPDMSSISQGSRSKRPSRLQLHSLSPGQEPRLTPVGHPISPFTPSSPRAMKARSGAATAPVGVTNSPAGVGAGRMAPQADAATAADLRRSTAEQRKRADLRKLVHSSRGLTSVNDPSVLLSPEGYERFSSLSRCFRGWKALIEAKHQVG